MKRKCENKGSSFFLTFPFLKLITLTFVQYIPSRSKHFFKFRLKFYKENIATSQIKINKLDIILQIETELYKELD